MAYMAALPERATEPPKGPDLKVLPGGKGHPRRPLFGGPRRVIAATVLTVAALGGGGLAANSLINRGGVGPEPTPVTPSPTVTPTLEVIPSPSPTETSNPTPEITKTPEITPSPTEAPTGCVQEADGIHWWATTGDNKGQEFIVPKQVEAYGTTLTTKLVGGEIHYFDNGKDVGILARNFAAIESDGTTHQVGIAMFKGSEVSKFLEHAPGVMPLPYAINEAKGMVTIGYDHNGHQGGSRAVVTIPDGSMIRVSEFNPQNTGVGVAVEHVPTNYTIYDPSWETASSVLGRVAIFGTGNGRAETAIDISWRTHLEMGHVFTRVSGESSIQIGAQGGNGWNIVDSSLFAQTADGLYIAEMPNS